MKSSRHSITRTQVKLFMQVSLIASSLITIAFIVNDLILQQQNFERTNIAIMNIIGSNSVAALEFQDSKAANETLATLHIDKDVLSAILYDAHKKLFASYVREDYKKFIDPILTSQKYFELKIDQAIFIRSIYDNKNKSIGHFKLTRDLSGLYVLIQRYLTIAVIVLFGTLTVTYWISKRLQRTITGPILTLTDASHRIASGNLEHVIDIPMDNEIGELAQTFNLMTRNLKETMVSRSTLEEKNEELYKAKVNLEMQGEALSRSNRELEQFAYIASHDLQEPLRMVTSYVKFLEQEYKGKLGEEADQYIHFAVDGALRMRTLINDLLSYSRVTTKAKPFSEISITDILEDVKNDLSIAIKENKATLILASFFPTIMGDRSQIAQIFLNLIGNAIKFKGKLDPIVKVDVEDQGVKWLFSIQDNGIGIDSKYNDKIFVIFQRLHAQTEYPGTGIGLAVCKKIIERHKGEIWVKSEPGQGATFFFTIPKGL